MVVLPSGKWKKSPGRNFAYQIIGPCCRLFDREALPWPSCSVSWRGKQPSWNRVGKRFVADMGAARSPSYSVIGVDRAGNCWRQILTIYYEKLNPAEKQWWYTRKPTGKSWPEKPEG